MYNRIIFFTHRIHIECFIKILKYQITSKMIFFSFILYSYCKIMNANFNYDFLLYVKNFIILYNIFGII